MALDLDIPCDSESCSWSKIDPCSYEASPRIFHLRRYMRAACLCYPLPDCDARYMFALAYCRGRGGSLHRSRLDTNSGMAAATKTCRINVFVLKKHHRKILLDSFTLLAGSVRKYDCLILFDFFKYSCRCLNVLGRLSRKLFESVPRAALCEIVPFACPF